MQAWWKEMAAYRRVYDSRHLQADCQEPGSTPEPYARKSSMATFTFFTFSQTTDFTPGAQFAAVVYDNKDKQRDGPYD